MKAADSETASKVSYIPLVLGPELAMARMPRLLNLRGEGTGTTLILGSGQLGEKHIP